MTFCPNRYIKRRVGLGGGRPQCPGRLETRLLVSVSLSTPRAIRGPLRPEEALPARARRSGVRITPGELAAALASRSTSDAVCPTCGWSRNRLMASVSQLCRKRRRAA